MLKNMPEIIAPRKRIVLEHTNGPHAGLMQITGHGDSLDSWPPPTATDEFETTVDPRKTFAQLVKATPRYLLYRELTKPEGLGTFDQRQR